MGLRAISRRFRIGLTPTSLHADLVRQARQLALKEPRRPSQASLRRAVSASCYALFHLLIDEATTRMFSGRDRAALRGCLGRAFVHADMKRVAQQFSDGGVSPKLSPGMNGQAVQPELTGVAATFVDLQQARHEADYDTPILATGRDRLGGPCRASIPGLEHCAKERSGRCVPRGAARVREHAHLRAARHACSAPRHRSD